MMYERRLIAVALMVSVVSACRDEAERAGDPDSTIADDFVPGVEYDTVAVVGGLETESAVHPSPGLSGYSLSTRTALSAPTRATAGSSWPTISGQGWEEWSGGLRRRRKRWQFSALVAWGGVVPCSLPRSTASGRRRASC